MARITAKITLPSVALLLMASVIASLTSGCAPYSALEQDFGNSVNQMKYVQTYDKITILNPALEPVRGLDGRAAENALKEYRNTFSKPEEDKVKEDFTFTLGTMSGGQ